MVTSRCIFLRYRARVLFRCAPLGAVRAAKFEGNILAEEVVGLDGKVTNVRVIKSPGLGMDESVTTTLEKWRCKPGKDRDGKPVPTLVPFQFTFHLYRTSD